MLVTHKKRRDHHHPIQVISLPKDITLEIQTRLLYIVSTLSRTMYNKSLSKLNKRLANLKGERFTKDLLEEMGAHLDEDRSIEDIEREISLMNHVIKVSRKNPTWVGYRLHVNHSYHTLHQLWLIAQIVHFEV